MRSAAALSLLVCAALAAPLLTQRDVDAINREQSSWRASLQHPYTRLERGQHRFLAGIDTVNYKSPRLASVQYTEKERLAAPSEFDSRKAWPMCSTMNQIRDQSSCGSCWAFGAASAMSDRECVVNKVNVTFSAEDINSCSKQFGFLSCGSCNGGNPGCAMAWWASTGVVSDDCVPYSLKPCDHHVPNSTNPCPEKLSPTPPCKSACNGDTKLDYKKDKRRASKSYTVRGEANMMTELATNGPCMGGFTVYSDFVSYVSGVYHKTSGASKEGGHAIKILGYGEENGVKYWLCANSWNTNWGDKGYFKIRRGTNECGIEEEMWCGTPIKYSP